ncbi:glycosyl hydrolase family 95 catalytic domain-containing protein [Phytoactinopolyspora endophytica]|uniref:glycoside hydrolase family 95 protein n=1 Tax=Phytoactinopolyspora endophytica TaxID=1642495 RepID=UPI00101BB501|nr:glycoside hydrolase family 95 protein [Phytoactinopolyspora endophytica]
MSTGRVLRYSGPAADWMQALPVGNGRLGGMVFGHPDRERIALNLDTLWSGGPRTSGSGGPRTTGLLDGPRIVSDVRRAVLEDCDPHGAGEASIALQGPDPESYQPLGDLLIDLEERVTGTGAYERRLDLATGVAWSAIRADGMVRTQQVLASAPAGVLAVRIEQAGRPLRLQARMDTPHRMIHRGGEGPTAVLTGRLPVTVAPEFRDMDDPVRYSDSGGMVFAMALRAVLDDGDEGSVALRDGVLTVDGARAVTLVLGAVDSFVDWRAAPGQDPVAVATAAVEAVVRAPGWSDLSASARADHGELMGRVRLDLGPARAEEATDARLRRVQQGETCDDLIATVVDLGRYLLVASSRPGTQAANLQGIWNELVHPPWASDWTVNINTEMNYWPAETMALPECAEPLIDLVESVAESGVRTARELYDAPGWVAHHNVDLWRSTWPVGEGVGTPNHAMWPMGGVWLSAHLAEHAAFAPHDHDLLERVWPILRGAAQFVLSLLMRDPRPGRTQGRWVSVPSTSPENWFVDSSGRHAAVDAMVTMDLWLVRELFGNVQTMADRLSVDDELVQRVRAVSAELPEAPIGPDGRLLEWSTPRAEAEPGHRHMSHLYGLHPGSEIDPWSTPELAAAARASLEERLAHGGGHTGWSRAWLVAFWARLGDGDKALENVDIMLRDSIADNLFDLHPPGWFQIDGNLGVAAAVAEMLVQSHTDVLRLLPALPTRWQTGSVRGLRARGGVTVDLRWHDGAPHSARLVSPHDLTLVVAWSDGTPFDVRLSSGTPVDLRF